MKSFKAIKFYIRFSLESTNQGHMCFLTNVSLLTWAPFIISLLVDPCFLLLYIAVLAMIFFFLTLSVINFWIMLSLSPCLFLCYLAAVGIDHYAKEVLYERLCTGIFCDSWVFHIYFVSGNDYFQISNHLLVYYLTVAYARDMLINRILYSTLVDKLMNVTRLLFFPFPAK